jgi:hypothetical protein
MIQGANRNVLKIGILSLAPLTISQSMLNPALPAIQAAFPIWYMFYVMFTFAFVTTTAMMAVGEHIATSADLGFTLSLLTISVSVVALFFGLTSKIFKRYVIAAGILVNAIAALVAFTGRSIILIDIAVHVA